MTRERIGHGLILLLFLGCAGSSILDLQAQAIVAPADRTLFHRGTLIRSFIKVEHPSLPTGGPTTEVTRYVTPLAVVYEFYPKWTMIAVQPYMSVDMTIEAETGTLEKNLHGLPDSQVFVQYDGLYSRNSPGGLTRLSAVLGFSSLQVPNGSRAEPSPIPED